MLGSPTSTAALRMEAIRRRRLPPRGLLSVEILAGLDRILRIVIEGIGNC